MKTHLSSKNAFRPIIEQLDDFLVWGIAEGASKLGYEWDSRVAWEEAVPSYCRQLQVERANTAVATETTRLLFLANNGGAAGSGYDEGRTVYPDGIVFAHECITFLSDAYSMPIAAYFLDVIDLQDLAKLCYDGDLLETKDQVAEAVLKLRGWFNGQPAQYPKNNSKPRLQSTQPR
tara:strand:+ start:492 stop:1019 length:528 start_codon:yes stop_codon:yes gene_type:complete